MSESKDIQKVEVQPVTKSLGERYAITPDRVIGLLRETSLKGTRDYTPTIADAYAFAIVANQYGLNPFIREIHAFCDRGKLVPIVGIDGWARIVNSQDKFDGCDLNEIEDDRGNLIAVECAMYIKGRTRPVKLKEYMVECARATEPWRQMPRRMLRHKAFMQCARYAFSIGGIYDPDEAEDIIRNATVAPVDGGEDKVNRINNLLQLEQPVAALPEPVKQPDEPKKELPESKVNLDLFDNLVTEIVKLYQEAGLSEAKGLKAIDRCLIGARLKGYPEKTTAKWRLDTLQAARDRRGYFAELNDGSETTEGHERDSVPERQKGQPTVA